MDLHLEPDLNPKKGIRAHKATVILQNGLTLHGIRITRGIGGTVKVAIPQPVPLSNAAGGKLTPAALDDMQRSMLDLWIRDNITERLKALRAEIRN